MSRTLLFNRAVALSHPRKTALAYNPFSTSKPSKGDKEKREEAGKNKAKGRPRKNADGPPLIIAPGTVQSFASLPHAPFDRSHSNSRDTFVHKNWTVNVSPFLDPEDYSKKSSFFGASPTKDGTLAAIRLNQGKKTLVELLQDNIKEHNRKQQTKSSKENNAGVEPRSFVIIGHGVPKQLLQQHVDMADFLLKYFTNASYISFKNNSGGDLERMEVYPKKGKRTLEQWPFEPNSNSDHQKQLYLTVMDRIAVPLNEVLWTSVSKTPQVEQDVDDDFVMSSTSLPASLKEWKVDLLRGSEYPSDSFLMLIVKFMLPENDSASGHIAISLCGKANIDNSRATRNKRRLQAGLVTLRFTATFENPNRKNSLKEE